MTKQPNLLAVLDRGLPILERRQVLERTIHPDAEECRFVRKLPVDVVGWRLLCGEPVVVVVLGLPHSTLLELVAVAAREDKELLNGNVNRTPTCQHEFSPTTHPEGRESSAFSCLN